MKINKKILLSILTAFVMAFTVFGCTGMSFAEGENPDTTAVGTDEPVVNEVDENAEVSTMSLPLDTPENDGSVAGPTSVTLKWTSVDPIDTGDPFQYWIYDSDAEGAAPIAKVEDPATTNPPTTWKKGDLTTGETYTFYIKAVEMSDEDGSVLAESAMSSAISLTCKANPIKAPSNIKVTSAYQKLTFTWDAVSKANDGTISYEIYESKSGSSVATKDADQRSFVKNGLSPRAKEYKAFIKAVEKDGNGNVIVESEWAELKGTPKGFQTQTLTGLISDPGYKAVLLQWNKVDGATGYKIYWRIGGERGNIDNLGKDSEGHNMMTFRSKKTRKYEIVKKPGKYEYLTEVKQPKSGTKVNFDKRGLKELNHTYVYFYQFMVIPYFDENADDDIAPIYTTKIPGNKWKASDVNKTTNAAAGKSNPELGIIRNNTVLPMYVLENAKVNKPIYKTCSMGDGKKRGRLSKGHKFICFDKANGRVKFYEKKNVSNPKATFWFAQKNAHTIQGYYMNNGNKNNLNRKDWKTGYSKKTVLDFVNKSGLSSKTGYLIWTSKYAQHVYIFTGKKGHWKLLNDGKTTGWKNKALWSNLCTSGKVNIQSRNGNYVIFGKQHTAKRAKYTYYYLSKLHKTVRLHSLLHKKGQKFGGKLYNKALGNPVSKGCIRLRPKVSKWIYDKVPKKTRCKVW